jgi:hypothetical protein
MKRRVLTALALGLGLFHASPARAQLLGAKGDAIFAAERLFGVRGEHWTTEPPAPENGVNVTDTTIAFGFAAHQVPYDIPRLAFDYMVINKLSVGGAVGFSHSDGNTTNGGAAIPPTTFLIAPRVGYLHMFGRVAGIWPRGGLVYHSASATNQFKESGLGFNAECMFPIVVAGHFGFEVGLTFDQSLTATRDPDNGPSYSITYRSIALQVGLFGWI